jgi:hypothetical protein
MMVDLKPKMPIITLNINGINRPTKGRDCQDGLKNPFICCP